VHDSVAAHVQRERDLKLSEPATWKIRAAVRHIRARLPELIHDLRARGKRVIGYGASAKQHTAQHLRACRQGPRLRD